MFTEGMLHWCFAITRTLPPLTLVAIATSFACRGNFQICVTFNLFHIISSKFRKQEREHFEKFALFIVTEIAGLSSAGTYCKFLSEMELSSVCVIIRDGPNVRL